MSYCNRKAQTINTLQSINKSKFVDNVSVIIVDDCSVEREQLDDIVDNYNFPIFLFTITKDRKNWYNPCVTYNYGFLQLDANDEDIIIIQNPECTHRGDVVEYSINNTNNKNYVVFNCASLDEQQTKKYIESGDFDPSKKADSASDSKLAQLKTT